MAREQGFHAYEETMHHHAYLLLCRIEGVRLAFLSRAEKIDTSWHFSPRLQRQTNTNPSIHETFRALSA